MCILHTNPFNIQCTHHALLQLTPTTHFTAIIHVLASTSSYELEDFVGAKFYCLHALGDGNKCSFAISSGHTPMMISGTDSSTAFPISVL